MKPRYAYLAVVVSLGLAFFAVAFISRTALEQERARVAANEQAWLEENVRLALWRMDSEITTLIAAENARPYFDYGAFYDLGRSYTQMFVDGRGESQVVPSPLLLGPPEDVKLHFQYDEAWSLSSPQVPVGAWRARALQWVSSDKIDAAESQFVQLSDGIRPEAVEARVTLWERGQVKRVADNNANVAGNAVAQVQSQGALSKLLGTQGTSDGLGNLGSSAQVQATKNSAEYNMRASRVQKASNYNPSYERDVAPIDRREGQGSSGITGSWLGRSSSSGNGKRVVTKLVDKAVPAPMRLRELAVPDGAMAPLWMGDKLLLVRQVKVGSHRYVQGCWVDWDKLKTRLLAGVSDILPDAQLIAASPEDPTAGRLLASLPVRLEPGPPMARPDDQAEAVALTLGVAWTAVIMAALAVLALLFGAVSLSERRAVFVSAVTHELRTPLTTFRMYADMLADGMVTDPDKSKRYIETLRREAVRLAHLVENVLAYSKIERGRAAGRPETVTLGEIAERFSARLSDRAEQAGMKLELELSSEVRDTRVHVDTSAVEQILFNLVDNACKYASSAEDKRIHLAAARDGTRVYLRVFDHGPGVSTEDKRGLFSPFSKSAQRAALSAPGVGLGLALSRQLARSMRGELRHEAPRPGTGASFALTLPSAPH